MSVVGVIKRFNASRGFGFIATQDREDTFVHASQIVGGKALFMGDFVAFKITRSTRGPQANDVVTLPPRCLKHDGQDGTTFAGCVKHVNLSKSFGFIESEQCSTMFKKETVYFTFEGCPPALGQQVQFQVMVGKGGKLEATDVLMINSNIQDEPDEALLHPVGEPQHQEPLGNEDTVEKVVRLEVELAQARDHIHNLEQKNALLQERLNLALQREANRLPARTAAGQFGAIGGV